MLGCPLWLSFQDQVSDAWTGDMLASYTTLDFLWQDCPDLNIVGSDLCYLPVPFYALQLILESLEVDQPQKQKPEEIRCSP